MPVLLLGDSFSCLKPSSVAGQLLPILVLWLLRPPRAPWRALKPAAGSHDALPGPASLLSGGRGVLDLSPRVPLALSSACPSGGLCLPCWDVGCSPLPLLTANPHSSFLGRFGVASFGKPVRPLRFEQERPLVAQSAGHLPFVALVVALIDHIDWL